MADYVDPSKAIIAAALIQTGHLENLFKNRDEQTIEILCALATTIHTKLYHLEPQQQTIDPSRGTP
jgi:hypothetical protein